MLELKEPQARSHARRTSEYAAQIGYAIQMERPEVEQLMLAAFLHEAALFRIPNEILLKDAPLTLEEQNIVNQNFEPGLEILERVPDLAEIASVLRFHYEHFDGTGQPGGFSGEQIPLHARILAVADAYDAMTAPRMMKSGLSHSDAIMALKLAAGTKFDPSVVAVFCALKTVTNVVDSELELLTI